MVEREIEIARDRRRGLKGKERERRTGGAKKRGTESGRQTQGKKRKIEIERVGGIERRDSQR